MKLEKRLIYGVVTCTLGFLFTYLTQFPSPSVILGSDQSLYDMKIEDPNTYILNCFKMIAELMQWSTLVSFAWNTVFDNMQVAEDMLQELVELSTEIKLFSEKSSGELVSPHMKNKRLSAQQNKMTHSCFVPTKVHILALKFCSLFWFLLINGGLLYLRFVRPNLFPQKIQKSIHPVSNIPINLSQVFGVKYSEPAKEYSEDSEASKLLLFIHNLWRLRTYEAESRYTLGCIELDTVENMVRPSSFRSDTVGRESLFEIILRSDLVLAGLNTGDGEINWFSGILKHQLNCCHETQGISDILFQQQEFYFMDWCFQSIQLHFYSNGRMENDEYMSSSEFPNEWCSLIRKLEHMVSLFPDIYEKPIIHSLSITFVPLTKQNMIYVVTKTILHWLSVFVKTFMNSTSANIAASLACVLCQVDVLPPTRYVGHIWPSPYPSLTDYIKTNWKYIRGKIAVWIQSEEDYIFDAGLICYLAELESSQNVDDPQ